MKKKTVLQRLIISLLIAGTCLAINAQEIKFSEKVAGELERINSNYELSYILSQKITVDNSVMVTKKNQMRQILGIAEKDKSPRSSGKQSDKAFFELSDNKVLKEGILTPQQEQQMITQFRPEELIDKKSRLFYEEDKDSFKYLDTTEILTEKKFSEKILQRQAQNYLVKNGLLSENRTDHIGRTFISKAMLNLEGKYGEAGKEYQVRTDVTFERSYNGIPIINSFFQIGVSPATGKILKLRNHKWIPLKKADGDAGRNDLLPLSAVRNRMEEEIFKEVSRNPRRYDAIDVTDGYLAYYIKDDQLVPIFAYSYELKNSQNQEDTADFYEIIDLTQESQKLEQAATPVNETPVQ